MIGLFYERKITNEEISQIHILSKKAKSGPNFRASFWDDSYQNPEEVDSLLDAFKEGVKHIGTIETKSPMSLVRYINFMQKLEDKYQFHKDDRIHTVYADGGIEFHMNNIDGWHP